MSEFNEMIEKLKEEINKICECLEKKENTEVYEKMPFIINKLSLFITSILQSGEFDGVMVLEYLKDMMQAIENKDSVLLLDTLQFGIIRLLDTVRIKSNKEI